MWFRKLHVAMIYLLLCMTKDQVHFKLDVLSAYFRVQTYKIMKFLFLLEAWQAENILLVWSVDISLPKSLNGWFIIKCTRTILEEKKNFSHDQWTVISSKTGMIFITSEQQITFFGTIGEEGCWLLLYTGSQWPCNYPVCMCNNFHHLQVTYHSLVSHKWEKHIEYSRQLKH